MSNFVISVIIAYNFSFSQELPEIPLKRGMAHYLFDHKLDNSTKCLSKYFSYGSNEWITFNGKASTQSYQLSLKKSSLTSNITLTLRLLDASKLTTGLKCIDTTTFAKGITLSKTGDLIYGNTLLDLVRKKVLQSDIEADISIVFKSKTEYILVVKNITYTVMYSQGLKSGVDVYNIGELYESVKNSGNITKKDFLFFEDLNFVIKSIDEIILKALTDTYLADEL
jgi:hypothetical protein